MTGLYKSVALFFSVLLVFTTIKSGSYSILPGHDLKIPGDEPIVSWSLNAGSSFIVFNNLGEKSPSPLKNVPESISKYQPYDFAFAERCHKVISQAI